MTEPTVGAQLRAARKFDRLTLRKVAEKVGVSFPHLSKVENDQETPSDDLLYKLAELYNLNGDLLVLYAGRVPPRFVAALTADPVRGLDLLSDAFPQVAGAGGGLDVPSNFTDSPTPTPTETDP